MLLWKPRSKPGVKEREKPRRKNKPEDGVRALRHWEQRPHWQRRRESLLPIDDSSSLLVAEVVAPAHQGGDPVGKTPGTRANAEDRTGGAVVKGGEERKRRIAGVESDVTLVQGGESDVNQGVAILPPKTHLPPTYQA